MKAILYIIPATTLIWMLTKTIDLLQHATDMITRAMP
jgi:hypothetical protein